MRTSQPGQRPAASVLGALLDRDGPSSLGEHLAHLGEAADHRQPRAPRPPPGRRQPLAVRRGPPRLRPPAPRAHRRPVAASADARCRRRTDPGPARWAHAGRSGPASRAGPAAARGRRDGRHPARAAPRPADRPQRRRRRRRTPGSHPGRDPRHRPDALRAVHGARALRARRRLLPRRLGSAWARGRLHHRPRAAPDLRPDALERDRGDLATPWRTDPVRAPRARGGDRHARSGHPQRARPRSVAVARCDPLRAGRDRTRSHRGARVALRPRRSGRCTRQAGRNRPRWRRARERGARRPAGPSGPSSRRFAAGSRGRPGSGRRPRGGRDRPVHARPRRSPGERGHRAGRRADGRDLPRTGRVDRARRRRPSPAACSS